MNEWMIERKLKNKIKFIFIFQGHNVTWIGMKDLGLHALSIAIVFYIVALIQRNKQTLDKHYKEWEVKKYFKWTRFK